VVYRELKLRDLPGVLIAAGRTTAAIMFLVCAALVSAWLITAANIPAEIAGYIAPLIENPRLLMLAIMALILVVGTALDLTPTILILTPVLMPIIAKAGIDPVYFGVMFIMNCCIGLLTPPVGVVLNVVSGVGRVPLGKVIRGVWPFLIAQILVILLLVAFPAIVIVPANWFY
jgi:TRAP-type transport system large permease protein